MVSVDKGESGRVFISYRRQETAWPARQLHDVLAAELGADRIFKDVDDIEPGDDFVEQIQSAVGSCQVLLALIGPQWLTVTDAKGARRIDDPADFVRLEVETALSRDDVRVIPILVDHAKMPTAEELPAGLAALTRRQAVEINPVSFDTHRLLRVLSETLNAAAAEPAAPQISRDGHGVGPAAVPPPYLRSNPRWPLQRSMCHPPRLPNLAAIEEEPEDERSCWGSALCRLFCCWRLVSVGGISCAILANPTRRMTKPSLRRPQVRLRLALLRLAVRRRPLQL